MQTLLESFKNIYRNRKALSCVVFTITILSIITITIQNSPRLRWKNALENFNPDHYPSIILPEELHAINYIQRFTALYTTRRSLFSNCECEYHYLVVVSPLGGKRLIAIPLTNNSLIISDPFTMILVQWATLRDILMPERVFVYEEEYSETTISFLNKLRRIFLESKDANEFIHKLDASIRFMYDNVDKPTYIVITRRTIAWLQSKQHFVLFPKVKEANPYDIMPYLKDSRYFRLIYEIPGRLYIFFVLR